MTVDDYIDSLAEERRPAIRAVREAINARLPAGYEEGIVYGMISWFVPFTRLAETYNDQPLCLASLGSQKRHMAVYLMPIYGDPKLRAWFERAFKAAGKKLDAGKACVRFTSLDQLPLDVISEAVARVPVETYVAIYENSRRSTKQPATKTAAKAKPAKKAAAKARPAKAKPAKAKPAKAKKPARRR